MKIWRNLLRSCRRLAVCATAMWMVAGSAAAQELLIPDSDLKCVQRVKADGLPEYPARELLAKEGGQVRLRLVFVDPESAPKVEVIGNSTVDELVDVAVRYAGGYRLPCMSKGAAPVVATQLYAFVPTDPRPVALGPLQDQDHPLSKCVELDGQVFPWPRKPRFPSAGAMRGSDGGMVLAQMTFVSPAQPPKVTILFDGGTPALGRSVEEFLADVRVPCMSEKERLTVMVPFGFGWEGGSRTVLRDLKLAEFLRSLGNELDKPSNKVRFDLSAMGCPFDVRFKLFRPYASNTVMAVGPYDERREPLLNWLRGVEMNLPARYLKHVLGGWTTISIPCGSLDLT